MVLTAGETLGKFTGPKATPDVAGLPLIVIVAPASCVVAVTIVELVLLGTLIE
jgi:hypothetical protein